MGRFTQGNILRWQTFAVLAACLLITACGFQLRGNIEIPDSLKRLNLSAAQNTALVTSLRNQLKANGVELVSAREMAPYQLHILSEQEQRRAISLSTNAETEEYELRSSVTFEVLGKEDLKVIPPTEVYTERVYRFDENNVNAKAQEEALLRREMRDNLAQQVIRRYLSLARSQQQ